MASVKRQNTSIEILFTHHLRRRGVSFTQHPTDVLGRPDVVFKRCKLAVFIDGDFWHGKDFESWSAKLDERWRTKIEQNISRDQRQSRKLRRAGWSVVRVWGSDIKRDPATSVEKVLQRRALRKRA
jgi:DNA mismatch endonuclease, patch repair protein